MGKLIEATCPYCKEIRTIQKRNQYDNAERPCRPCSIQRAKHFLNKNMFRKNDR